MSENGGRAGRVTRRWQGLLARVRGYVRGFAAWLRSGWQRLVKWGGLPMAITVTFLGLVYVIIAFGLLIAFALALRKAIDAGTDLEGDAIRNIGLALVAVVSAPFVVWRSIVADRQARTADAALFNEKIHAASNDLHAIREITRGETNIREDDVTRRNTAIDRLEALANERPDEAPRIGRMLSVYLRELSREYPPQDPPEGASPADLREWARGLKPVRSDMERAAQSIGRLLTIEGMTPERLDIDLSEINMQGFDLEKAHLRGANLEAARLEGAKLSAADLGGANLTFARLQGAILIIAQLQNADLDSARLQGARLFSAQLQNTDLGSAQLQGTLFHAAQLQGAGLDGAQLQGANLNLAHLQDAALYRARFDPITDFSNADTSHAALGDVDLSDTNISNDQIRSMFGDATVILPDSIPAPEHWPSQALDLDTFKAESARYKANPTAYIPPQNRPGTV